MSNETTTRVGVTHRFDTSIKSPLVSRRSRLGLLAASTALVGVALAPNAWAQNNPGTIITSNTSLSGTIAGNNNGGYFVSSGTLTVSNGSLTGFVTTGGSGSGGGAGLGGAIFIDANGTAILNNVTLANNTAVGGEGGTSTTGGSLDNLFNGGTPGATGADGVSPVIIHAADPGGQSGSVGLPGAAGTVGQGGTGGKGGDGTDGGSSNPFLIEVVVIDTANLAADIAEASNSEAKIVADNATTADDTAHVTDDAAHVAADEAQSGATAEQLADDTIITTDDGIETADDTAETVTLGVAAGADGAAEAEFTDAAIASADLAENIAVAIEDGTQATEEGLIAAAEGDKVAADGLQQAADDTEGGVDQLTEEADSTKVLADNVKKAADETLLTAQNVHNAADLVALQTDTASLFAWDQALANGQFGMGGGGANGGQAGTGAEGYGGGLGGNGGNGGNGGSNWSGSTSTFQGGAIGGNGGQGGNGGDGGFGAGGGSGGDGGAYGLGAVTSAVTRANGQQGPAGNGGSGGFGGGNGSNGTGFDTEAGGGGGGSAYGGSIFVNTGGTLDINGSATFNNDSVVGGDSANGGSPGQAYGTDLFIMQGANVTLAPGSGQYIIFNGTIDDNSVASIGQAGGSVATGNGGGLTVAGAPSGVVEFNNTNTYTGTTTLQSGVLQAQDGSNIDSNSNITFDGGVLQSSGLFNRFVGTLSSQVQWTNTGGHNGGGFSAIGSGLTVSLSDGANLVWGAHNFINGTGATLDFGSTTATADVTFTNNINLNGAQAHIANTANLLASSGVATNTDYVIITGVLSNGSVVFGNGSQTGVVELTGANTYAGGTEVAGGTLVIGAGGSLNATGAVLVDAGATFDNSGGGNQAVGGLTGNGTIYLGNTTLTVNATSPVVFNGVIADGGLSGGTGGNLVINGVSQTLTGINVYTGSTTIDAGADLALTNGGQIALSSGVVDNGNFDVSAASEPVSQITTLSGNGTVAVGANTLMITAGSTSFAGGINGTGNLDVTGGTQTLTGVNTLTGMVLTSQGATVALSGAGSVADASTINDNGTFDISAASNGGSNVISVQGTGSVVLGSNTLTLTNAGGDFSGVISGAGNLTVAAGGEELDGVNTYTGKTLVDAGVDLVLNGSGSIANSSEVTDNGTVDISADSNGGTSFTTMDGNGTLYLGANTLTLSAASGTFAGNVFGTGGLTVAAGTEKLSATNNYTGNTTVDSGATLDLIGAGKILNSADVVDNGTFSIAAATGGGSTIKTLSGNGSTVLGSNTLTLSAASTNFAGNINGAGNVTVAAGTETLSGVNTFTGVTTINAGATVDTSGAGSLSDSSLVTDNGTFNIAASSNGGTAITTLNGNGSVLLGSNTLTLTAAANSFDGVISGAGGGLSVQAGTETLTNVETYTGATSVAAGADLILTGNAKIAASSGVADAGTFDISAEANGGTTITTLSQGGSVLLGSNTLTLSDASTNFSGDISGTGNLTVAAGTETLSGVNGYTGATTVNAGAALDLAGVGSIAASSGVTDNGAFDIAQASNGGSLIKTLAGNGTVNLGSNTLTLTQASSTFAGQIGGAGNLTLQTGAEALTGVNSYTGATNIAAGTDLALLDNASIADSSGVADNGTFDISSSTQPNTAITTLSGNGTVLVGANNFTLTAASTTFAGVMSGTGTLDVTGGDETLTGVNTLSGDETIAPSATLALSGAGSISDAALLTDNGTFDISAASNGGSDIQSLAGTGAVALGANTLTLTDAGANFAGVIGGTGGLTVAAGTEQLSGVNSFTGATLIDAGAAAQLVGAGAIASSSDVIDNGTFDISQASNGGSSITTLDGNGAVLLGSNRLTLTAAAGSFAGAVQGTGGLTVAAGTEQLSGANNYTGATVIAAGATTQLVGSGSIATSSDVTDNGTFDISQLSNGGTSITTLDGNGVVTLGANNLSLTAAAGTFAGVVQGTGGLAVTAGTETLSGVNSYTGVTSVASGAELDETGAGSVAASAGVLDNGTFSIANASNGGASIQTLAGGGNVALGSNTLTLTNARTGFDGVIAGAGNLTVAAGTQVLTGTSTYTGATSIAQGADLVLSGNASILSSSGVADLGTFDVSGENNGGTTIESLSGNGTVVVGANVLNIADQTTSFTGALLGTGYINILNGSFTLPTNNSGSPYMGTLGVNNSTINLNQSSDNGLGGPISTDNGTIDTSSPTVITQNLVVNGVTTLNGPSNTGTTNVSGSNATTLTGNISGSGTLDTTGNVIDDGTGGTGGGANIQGGVFEVGDSSDPSAVFDGNINDANGSTLRGHGTIVGNVSSSGNVFPGGSIGTLTITGNYTQSSTGTFTVELTPSNATPGVTFDQLKVGGTASIAGSLALQIDPAANQYKVGTVYQGVLSAGTLSGTFASVSGNQVYNGYEEIDPEYSAAAVNLEVKATNLAYSSGNAVLASEFVDNAAEFGAMDDIIASAPQKAGEAGSLVDARIGSWGVADGSVGNANDDRISDYNLIAGNGFAITPDLTVGIAYSRIQTTTKSAQDNVQGAGNGFYGYGAYNYGNWQLSAVIGGGVSQLTSARELASAGLQANGSKAESFYNDTVQIRYRGKVDGGYLVPFLRVGTINATRGVFSDSGAGTLDITYAGHHGLVTAVTAGARAGYSANGTGYTYQPWVELSGTGYGGATTITNPETIGSILKVQTAKAAPSGAANIGTGINLVKGAWTGTLSYGGQFGSGTVLNTFTGTLTYRW